jgi:phage replication-related protein YjqB (UPF0714/DUF867 family)
MNNNQGSYRAQFELDTVLAKEHCRANRDQIEKIEIHRDEQVRIEFQTADGTISAVYTVSTFHNDEEDLVFLGEKIQALLENCQKISNTHTCKGEVKAQVTIEGLNDYEAEKEGEFIEYLSDNGQNHKLVVIAPHGGEIEPWTDKQARYAANQFSSEHASLWTCKGFGKGGNNAYERWHITSTEISQKSFPKLNTIFGRTFEYSIAFHGWTKDFICVGGSKQSTENGLIREIKDAIKNTLIANESSIDVKDSECPECQEEFNGNSLDNIVNRLGTNGIQIEQCLEARKQYYTYIAKAVADVIRFRLNG